MTDKKWLVLIGTGISTMLIGIDFTIVNTALATMQSYFSANIATLQWFMMGFGITFTAFLTATGRISDKVGRRRSLYVGMIGFALASIGAGLSWHSWHLIAFRVIQGICGGVIFPSGIGLVAAAFPKEEHGKALGMYFGLTGIGLAAGPFLGGIIISLLSWRWIFFINIPVLILSFLFCLPTVKESKSSEAIVIDWKALFLMIISLASLVFAITEGPLEGWGSIWTVGGFVLFVLTTALFIYFEITTASPLLPLKLFMNRGFLIGALTLVVSVSFSWPVLFLTPLYLQNVLDLDPDVTGWMLLPMTLVTVLSAPTMGRIFDKKGAYPILVAIFISLVSSYILQCFFTVTGPIWLILIAFPLFGFAWGAGNGVGAPIALKYQSGIEDASTLTGALGTILNIFGVITLAVTGTIFRYGERHALWERLKVHGIQVTPSDRRYLEAALSTPEKAGDILSKFGALGNEVLEIFREAFVAGYHTAIFMLLVVSLVIFVGIFFALRDQRQTRGP